MVSGLAWVSVAALGVETAQRDAAARADTMNKERLALWRLDGRMLPSIGLENNRPYAHYFALHVPAPVVLTATGEQSLDPGRVPSPLLSTDLPDWAKLHFHIDPDRGWDSPQVISTDLGLRLKTDPIDLSLANVTPDREKLLADLRAKFPTSDIISKLSQRYDSEPDSPPYVVPVPFSDDPATGKPAPNWKQGEPTGWSKPACPEEVINPLAPAVVVDEQARAGAYSRPSSGFGLPFDRLFRDEAQQKGKNQQEPLAKQDKANASQVYGFTDGKKLEDPVSESQEKRTQQVPPLGPIVPQATRSAYQQDLTVDGAARKELAQSVMNSRGGNEGKYGNLKTANAPQQKLLSQGDANQLAEKSADQAGEDLSRSVTDWVENFGRSIQNRSRQSVEEKGKDLKDSFRSTAEKAGPVAAPAPAPPGAAKKAESEAKAAVNEPGTTGGGGAGSGAPVEGAAKDVEADRRQLSAEKARRESGRYLALAKTVGRDGQPLPEVVAGERKPAPVVRPVAVHLGPMRPRWITAPDGTDHLFLFRTAQVDDKTVYQGVLVDWELLKAALAAQVEDLFPAVELKPVRPAEETAPELTMTSLPVRLDPGPPLVLPPLGWSPLRIGLVLAWAAALLAITAVGVGGRAVLALSERRIRFVSAVTHELRSPLTAMQLHLDLLNSGLIDDETKKAEYLTTVGTEAERLNRLVENVLDFARLEKRTALASAKPIPVAELLESVSMTWEDRLRADGFELIAMSNAAPNINVVVDPRVITQVLGNLLDNARKYAREAIDRRIWLWLKPGERGRVVFEIEDRGPGIPTSERRSIFRPFHRGAAHSDSGGVGLGLSLAKQWAELYSGTITYRPADGGTGACFRLELPVG